MSANTGPSLSTVAAASIRKQAIPRTQLKGQVGGPLSAEYENLQTDGDHSSTAAGELASGRDCVRSG